MAQPSNWHSIHTKSQNFLPISQYGGLEDQNRPEATFHQKLATDSDSPESTLTHIKSLYNSHHELDQLTRHMEGGGKEEGGGRANVNGKIARKLTEIGW